jgi:hypothetical protein
MLDLKKYDTRPASEEGRWLTLKDPETGDDLPARIRLKSTDSQAWKDTQLAQRRARLELFDKSGTTRVDPTVADAEDLERLVAVTVEWEGLAQGEEPWPCTPANAREFYTGWPAFKPQIVAYIAQRANFLPLSASGS